MDCLSPEAHTRVNVPGVLKSRTPIRFAQSMCSTLYAGCASFKNGFAFCTFHHNLVHIIDHDRSAVVGYDRKLPAPKACLHFVQQTGASLNSVTSSTAIPGETSTSSTFKLLESWKMAGEAPRILEETLPSSDQVTSLILLKSNRCCNFDVMLFARSW